MGSLARDLLKGSVAESDMPSLFKSESQSRSSFDLSVISKPRIKKPKGFVGGVLSSLTSMKGEEGGSELPSCIKSTVSLSQSDFVKPFIR